MAKEPRRKRNPVVTVRLGSMGKIVFWSGSEFNVSNGDDASLTQVANNISLLCNIG